MLTNRFYYTVKNVDGAILLNASFTSKQGEDVSDLAAVRRVKAMLGWNGVRCKKIVDGEEIFLVNTLNHHHVSMRYHTFGRAS